MKLTAKQEKFCQGIIKGMSQADAYRSAYDTRNRGIKTVWEHASRLAADVKVMARIEKLRQPAVEKAMITLESHLEDLMKLRNLAVSKEQVAAAITAEIARGKAAGIHIEKSQINLNNLNPMVIVRYGNSLKQSTG